MKKTKNNILKDYFKAYGGLTALIKSPYVRYSLILSILLNFGSEKEKWVELTTNMLPNIVGFCIAAYAILMSVNNEKFIKILSDKYNDETPPFLSLSASFCHFVIIQMITIVYAALFSIFEFKNFLLNLIGLFLFSYSLMLVFATTLMIFSISKWFIDFINKPTEN